MHRLIVKVSRLRAAALAAAVAIASIGGPATVYAADILRIETRALSNREFLQDAQTGRRIPIGGELFLPGDGGKVPAVILLHGAAGITPSLGRWAAELNAMDVAALLLDSHTGRLAAGVEPSSGQISHLSMLYDAYRARDALAAHPRIDATRVTLMGFSKGGLGALYGGMLRFQRMHGGGHGFAAYLAFYPPCNYSWIDDEQVDFRPLRVFMGEADDWSPIAACRDHVAHLAAAGRDVGRDMRVIGYAGAHHAFDSQHIAPDTRLPNNLSAFRCRFVERPAGIIVNDDTGRPLAPGDACLDRGSTLGYDATAHEAAIGDVRDFLRSVFQLK
jgi:dienelactone hydrolase